jgi:RNA-directed DNA polymerase
VLTSVWSLFTREIGKPTLAAKQMTARFFPTGAAPRVTVNWETINWNSVHNNVRRLQLRIVKAIQQGRWGKVKSLQHLLTRSFSGKALAVKRVTENRGKRTAGVDGVLWNTPQKKTKALASLHQHGYSPQPLRRIYIPKSNGKKRPISIPTMQDRAMQALYLLALEPVAETTADPNSYGFRPARSTADAMAMCFHLLSRRCAPQWIIEGDIRSCFDKIDHHWLLMNIPIEKAILRKWLAAGFVVDQQFYPTTEGTPQGGIASPVLANMTLDGLERMLQEKFSRPQNGQRQLVNLVRYCSLA